MTTETSIDTYDWITCEYGQYRIEKTRWKTYRSLDKEGNPLVIGLTRETVKLMTPIHMYSRTPGYDGSHDSHVQTRDNFVEL